MTYSIGWIPSISEGYVYNFGETPCRALARCRYDRIRRAVDGRPCGWLSNHEHLIVLHRRAAAVVSEP